MAKPITFFGADSLLQGFKNTAAEGWSISAGSQFLTKGIGAETLKSFLILLDEGTKNTIYTLRIYEDIDDAKKIKEKTEADGSFNFVLADKDSEWHDGQYSDTNRRNKLLERLGNVEAVIAKMASGNDDEEEPEEEKSFIGAITDSIKSPEDILKLVNIGKAILGMQPIPIPQGFATIGSIPGDTPGSSATQTTADIDMVQRAQTAINILEKNDPHLVQHLEKLAKISEQNKTQFQNLLSMLDMFP
jgi:hypothetical protein